MTTDGPISDAHWINRLDQGLGALSAGCLYLGSALIVATMVWVTTDVVTRAIGGPFLVVGSAEIVTYALVLMTFLFAPFVVRNESHIRSTMIPNRLSKRWRRRVYRAANLVGAVIFALLAYASLSPAIAAIENHEMMQGGGQVQIPAAFARFVVLAMSVLSSAEFLMLVVKGERVRGLSTEVGEL